MLVTPSAMSGTPTAGMIQKSFLPGYGIAVPTKDEFVPMYAESNVAASVQAICASQVSVIVPSDTVINGMRLLPNTGAVVKAGEPSTTSNVARSALAFVSPNFAVHEE